MLEGVECCVRIDLVWVAGVKKAGESEAAQLPLIHKTTPGPVPCCVSWKLQESNDLMLDNNDVLSTQICDKLLV